MTVASQFRNIHLFISSNASSITASLYFLSIFYHKRTVLGKVHIYWHWLIYNVVAWFTKRKMKIRSLNGLANIFASTLLWLCYFSSSFFFFFYYLYSGLSYCKASMIPIEQHSQAMLLFFFYISSHENQDLLR
jgi:hypothetical protein